MILHELVHDCPIFAQYHEQIRVQHLGFPTKFHLISDSVSSGIRTGMSQSLKPQDKLYMNLRSIFAAFSSQRYCQQIGATASRPDCSDLCNGRVGAGSDAVAQLSKIYLITKYRMFLRRISPEKMHSPLCPPILSIPKNDCFCRVILKCELQIQN